MTDTITREDMTSMAAAFIADPTGWPAAMATRAVRLRAGHRAYSPTNQALILVELFQRGYRSGIESDAALLSYALDAASDETAPMSVWRKRGYAVKSGMGLPIWSKPLTLYGDESGATAFTPAKLTGENVKPAGRMFTIEQTYLARDVRNSDGRDARANYAAPELPEGDARDVFARLSDWIGAQGWKVTRTRKDSAESGSTSHAARMIRVHGGLTEWAAVETLAHEIAHALLHGADDDRPYAGEHRGDMEAEAEAVAYGVMVTFGQLEAARGSARYAAEWAGTPERVGIAFDRACHVLDAVVMAALGNADVVVKESAKAAKAAAKASNQALAQTLRDAGIEPRGKAWALAKSGVTDLTELRAVSA